MRTPASRMTGPDPVAVSFTQVKIQRDVYVGESDGLPMGTLESQKEGSADSSGDLPKIDRSTHSPV